MFNFFIVFFHLENMFHYLTYSRLGIYLVIILFTYFIYINFKATIKIIDLSRQNKISSFLTKLLKTYIECI